MLLHFRHFSYYYCDANSIDDNNVFFFFHSLYNNKGDSYCDSLLILLPNIIANNSNDITVMNLEISIMMVKIVKLTYW